MKQSSEKENHQTTLRQSTTQHPYFHFPVEPGLLDPCP